MIAIENTVLNKEIPFFFRSRCFGFSVAKTLALLPVFNITLILVLVLGLHQLVGPVR